MTKLATGLLIDPVARAIGPVKVDPTNLAEIYLVLGCKVVEYVPLDADNFICVDEEGLLRDKPEPFFQIRNNAPIAGRGLVLGIDHKSGESISTDIRIGDLWEAISFPDIEFIGMQHESGIADDPMFGGKAASISFVPVFRQKGTTK